MIEQVLLRQYEIVIKVVNLAKNHLITWKMSLLQISIENVVKTIFHDFTKNNLITWRTEGPGLRARGGAQGMSGNCFLRFSLQFPYVLLGWSAFPPRCVLKRSTTWWEECQHVKLKTKSCRNIYFTPGTQRCVYCVLCWAQHLEPQA